MLFSAQLVVAAATFLASSVGAEVGCVSFSSSDQKWYTSPSGECCSADLATAKRNAQGEVTDVRCGDDRTTESLEGVPVCNGKSPFGPECSNGIRTSVESFPQQPRCGIENAAAASAGRLDDKVGCYMGRIYANSGECCSIDYAKVERDYQGRVTSVRCGDVAGALGPDNLDPENLEGVPKCNGAVVGEWCPNGVHVSESAFERTDVCSAQGCCPELRQTRDERGVCKWNSLNFSNAAESKRFWAERDRDGCGERRGEYGHCCPDKKQFRNSDGVCTTKSFGEEVSARRVAQWRRADGCDD